MEPDITEVISKFSDGVTPVDYRYAAAWHTGVIIGSAVMGEIPYVAIRVEPRDDEIALYTYYRGSRWVQWLQPLFSLWRLELANGANGVEYGTRFVLVRPGDVKERVAGPVMSPRPHKCPRCQSAALIMTSMVSCTWSKCPNYDSRA